MLTPHPTKNYFIARCDACKYISRTKRKDVNDLPRDWDQNGDGSYVRCERCIDECGQAEEERALAW